MPLNENSETIQVTGRFYRRLYRSNDGSHCVCLYTNKKETTFTAVGCDLPEVTYPVTFAGRWTVNQKYGKQFQVDMVVNQLPDSRKDIAQYISSLKTGIGVKRAEKMIDLVGLPHFWDALNRDPLQFCSIKGIDPKTILLLKALISKSAAQENLFRLFGADLPCSSRQYKKILAFFDNNTEEMIKQISANPFILMKCGYMFKELDRFCCRKASMPVNSYMRLLAAAQQALMDARQKSHVGLPEGELISSIDSLLAENGRVTNSDLILFLESATQNGALVYDLSLYYLPRSYQEEEKIAEVLKQLACKTSEKISRRKFSQLMDAYSEEKGFSLSPNQCDAVWTALTKSVCVITGGPGTGKSTILDALLFCWKHFFDSDWILMAPTGKASVRMTETTQQPATTIHSTLGLFVGNDDLDEMDTHVNMTTASLVVVDESSMIDQSVMASVCMALQAELAGKPLQHLVLVGDPDQIPSVGWGNVLADIIDSESIPVCRLSTIYRQGEGNPIITNSLKMKEGNTELLFDPQSSFKRFHHGEDDATGTADEKNADKACQFYLRCVKHYGIENVVLLSPYHKGTQAISTNSLNRKLQDALNPDRGQGKILQFREGDRVMQLKNTDLLSNGDVGTIVFIDTHAGETDPCLIVEFENGIRHSYIKESLVQLELAYAITIHKSQGSQYQNVIVMMPNRFTPFIRRNLLYTAITRSSKNVAIFGPLDTIRKSIENNKKDDRYSNLKNRLEQIARSQTAA